jgi:multiple sugar transport system substrate-binding protein
MNKKFWLLLTLLLVATLIIACGGGEQAANQIEEQITDTGEVEVVAEEPEAPAEPVQEPAASGAGPMRIRWFIGLGAGSNPEEVEREQAFAELFNSTYGDQYELVLDIVTNETAYDVLKTQFASGDVPDIVGPVGVRGMYSFEGAWLDLAPYIADQEYDLGDFNPALIEFYHLGDQGQVGIPFAVYPSALWYNKDLFDEAGLEYPPHEWGAPYADGDDWTFDKLRELALFLTVDANGDDATMDGFDPDNIVQFGYHPQWTDARGAWTFFAPASFVGDDGNATMPAAWRDAAHWYFDGMWKDYFVPNGSYVNSDLLGQGNTFGSGNVAMTPIHTWYTCCFQDTKWDVAAIPSHNGRITAKLHADTFVIPATAKNPDAAFEVLSLMLGEFADELVDVYGAFPARISLQDEAVARMQEAYPDADLQVFVEALNYPDNPNHESGMPNFLKATDAYVSFASLYETDPSIDLDAEIDKLIGELDKVFKEVE